MAKANVVLVREFLNMNTDKPVTSPELMAFWKATSDEEHSQFANEIRTMHPSLDPIAT